MTRCALGGFCPWLARLRGREGGRKAKAVAAAAEASPAVFEITLSLHEACRCLTPPGELKRTTKRRRRRRGRYKKGAQERKEDRAVCQPCHPRASERARSSRTSSSRRRSEERKRLSGPALDYPSILSSFLSSLELLQLPQNLEELRGLGISMITLAASLLSHSRSAIDDPRATIRIGD